MWDEQALKGVQIQGDDPCKVFAAQNAPGRGRIVICTLLLDCASRSRHRSQEVRLAVACMALTEFVLPWLLVLPSFTFMGTGVHHTGSSACDQPLPHYPVVEIRWHCQRPRMGRSRHGKALQASEAP